MKKRPLLFTAAAALIYLTTTSYVSGPALNGYPNQTGSPGSGGTCAVSGCHSTGTSLPNTTGSIELRKKAWGASSTPVDYYEAGETYIVTLRGNNSSNSLTHFGFQLTALKNSDNTPVGTYGNLAPNTHSAPSSNPAVVEHSQSLAKSTSGDYEVTFEWTAPSASAGQITLYAIINAVNNNLSVTGDKPSATITLPLNDLTSVANVSHSVVFKAYPNPVRGVLHLDMSQAYYGIYDIHVYNATGILVASNTMSVNQLGHSGTINTDGWASGMYYVQVQADGVKEVIPVLKQ